MSWLAIKVAVTAALVVVIGEVARRSDRLGGLVAALPWVTLLALVWRQAEGQPGEKLARHAQYTFWYVLPTLPMFLLFPWLLMRWGFGPALLASVASTALLFLAWAWALRHWGIELL